MKHITAAHVKAQQISRYQVPKNQESMEASLLVALNNPACCVVVACACIVVWKQKVHEPADDVLWESYTEDSIKAAV